MLKSLKTLPKITAKRTLNIFYTITWLMKYIFEVQVFPFLHISYHVTLIMSTVLPCYGPHANQRVRPLNLTLMHVT